MKRPLSRVLAAIVTRHAGQRFEAGEEGRQLFPRQHVHVQQLHVAHALKGEIDDEGRVGIG